MEIKPSNIFYSHDTIMYRFRKKLISSRFYRGRRRSQHSAGIPIGKTLDQLCDGDCTVNDIPKITITKKDGKWFTLDNRRLWVFHHYESFLKTQGKSLTVPVLTTTFNETDHGKNFTTKTEGVSIQISGGNDPEGNWYQKVVPVTPVVEEEQNNEPVSGENLDTDDNSASENSDTYQADKSTSIDDDTSELKTPSGLIVSETPEQNGITSFNNDDTDESKNTNGTNNVRRPDNNETGTTIEMKCTGSFILEEIPEKIDVADKATSDKEDKRDSSNSQLSEEHVNSAISGDNNKAIEDELLKTGEKTGSHTTVVKEEETMDEVKPIKRSFSQLENTESENEMLYKRQKSEDN